MSRIGVKPIALPSGVEVKQAGETITVKGSKGQLDIAAPAGIGVNVEDNVANVTRETDTKELRALHGTVRALVQNMVIGVSEGYQKKLEIVIVPNSKAASWSSTSASVTRLNDAPEGHYAQIKPPLKSVVSTNKL